MKTLLKTTAAGLLMLALGSLSTSSLYAGTLEWNFSIDEQQVKNGPEADGSTNSPGTGTGYLALDTETNILSYTFSWENLFGDLTKLHIHGAAGSDASTPRHILEFYGPPEVPAELATTDGTVSGSFEITTLVQDGYDDIPPEEIISTLISGQAYLNVHTTVFGMGEIRGNVGVPVPEPATAVALLVGVGCVTMTRRSR